MERSQTAASQIGYATDGTISVPGILYEMGALEHRRFPKATGGIPLESDACVSLPSGFPQSAVVALNRHEYMTYDRYKSPVVDGVDCDHATWLSPAPHARSRLALLAKD